MDFGCDYDDVKAVIPKYSEQYMKREWDEIEAVFPSLIETIATETVGKIARTLLKLNLRLGRGLLANKILEAQRHHKGNESLYAQLVAKINKRQPEVGKLIVIRALLWFKRCMEQKIITTSLSSAVFVGQLINYDVVKKTLAYEILDHLVSHLSTFYLEVAAVFLIQCLQKFSYESNKISPYIEKINDFALESTNSDAARAVHGEFLEAYRNTKFWTSSYGHSDSPKSFLHDLSFNGILEPEHERDSFFYSFLTVSDEEMNRDRKRRKQLFRYEADKRRELEISLSVDYKFQEPERICLSRWEHDFYEILLNSPPGISVRMDPETKGCLDAAITGPEGTPYAGGLFWVKIWLPASYPFKAPVVRFITRIFHPNIGNDGSVRANFFTDKCWSPAMNIEAVLLTLQSLLHEPDLNSPLCSELGNLWSKNTCEARKVAKKYTRAFAALK